jgi:hypothetical protein
MGGALVETIFPTVLGYFVGSKLNSRVTALAGGLVCSLLGLAVSAYLTMALSDDGSGVKQALLSAHFTPNAIGISVLLGVLGASLGFRRRKDKDRQKQLMEEINQAQE